MCMYIIYVYMYNVLQLEPCGDANIGAISNDVFVCDDEHEDDTPHLPWEKMVVHKHGTNTNRHPFILLAESLWIHSQSSARISI